MKDGIHPTLAMAVNPESMERILERDKQEIEIEKETEKLESIFSTPSKKREKIEVISKISRKYYELANGMVEDSQYSEAIDLYTKSIATLKKAGNKKAVDSYFNRAIALAMMGYPGLALDDLKAITRVKPPKADFYFVKGQILESIGKEKLAAKMYKKSLDIDPSFYRATNSLENMRLR